MTMLEANGLTVRAGGLTIVDDVSFSVGEGEWLMLVGPNGAGKSTIVNALSRGCDYSGKITLGGRDIRHIRPAEYARSVGVLAQTHAVGYSFTVGEIVRLGRYAYAQGFFSARGSDDEEKVRRALEATGMLPLEGQSMLTLSGGEVQRAFLAQLFTQEPRLLILDEPTNHLDLVYQKQIFALLADWLGEGKRAIVSVVHDLSLARAYGTHALLLDRGKTAAVGTLGEVLSAENLDAAYSMDVYGWMRSMLSQWQDETERPYADDVCRIY